MSKDQLGREDAEHAIVYYHSNCMDGFASAWAFHILKDKDYAQKTSYIPMTYGESPFTLDPMDSRPDIYILDFSFPREIILSLAAQANKVLVLDHHKTAKEALIGHEYPENVHIVFDMERSGAAITWDWFGYENNSPLHKIPRPRLIRYVNDRDLWKFELPWSKELNAVVAVTEKEFKEYTDLNVGMEMNLNGMVQVGKYLVQQFEKLVKEISDDARECTIEVRTDTEFESVGEIHTGLVSNCSPQFSSEVGNVLAIKTGTFGATYHSDRSGKVKWSLRSVGDFDVSRLAKQFGGGGHKNAAGFVLADAGESTDKTVRLWAQAPDAKLSS